MAMDEALLETARHPILRVYRWAAPAVSFGYFEKWMPVENAHRDREPVRRWTGGGVVLHGEDFTYSLLAPAGSAWAELEPMESYRAIHEALAAALQSSGAPVALAEENAAKKSAACFENPVRHDIVLNNRKVAGAAQRRTRFGCLHQGSVQLPVAFPGLAQRLADELSAAGKADDFPLAVRTRAVELVESRYGAKSWLEKF